MEDRLSKQAILDRLDLEYRRLLTTIARLQPEQMLVPEVVGEWSVKDVLAHLVYWNQFPVKELETALAGEKPEYFPDDPDVVNAQTVARFADRSLDEVLAAFEDSFLNVIAAVESLPESAFEPENPLEQSLDETVAGTFGNNTYEHWPIHEAQIRLWIEQMSDNEE